MPGAMTLFALSACGVLVAEPVPRAVVAPFVPGAEPAYGAAPDPISDLLRCDRSKSRGCFALVPGGHFLMGAQAADPAAPNHDPRARPDEGPVHEVHVGDLWVMRMEAEVVVASDCIAAGWCDPAGLADPALAGSVHQGERGPRVQRLPDRAVTGLSWTGAKQLCAFVGARLPTESEWEWLARGAEARLFPWGSEPGCGLQTKGVSVCELSGVASFSDLVGSPTGGAFDLVGLGGNVWEWTEDVYAAEAYAGGEAVAAPGSARVQRGGGWLSTDPWELRAAARGAADPASRLPDVGVRCVRDAP